ncbi:unnamed protein product [Cylicostephanus goldi]|uniref:Uncharacterized protein n=1 Tax=Cylicostephanus goldi TaxID=71465 RepID=A0A3P7LX51_CYLGO|nr:unnamed protein product [Cylicostephanus goldi]
MGEDNVAEGGSKDAAVAEGNPGSKDVNAVGQGSHETPEKEAKGDVKESKSARQASKEPSATKGKQVNS